VRERTGIRDSTHRQNKVPVVAFYVTREPGNMEFLVDRSVQGPMTTWDNTNL
jgi:hypothetical protein